jgi:hypothetical protein
METYTVGNRNGSYFESLSRERYKTPKSLRDQGIFLELPYKRVAEAQKQTVFTPVDIWGIPRPQFGPYTANVGYLMIKVANEERPQMADIISKLGDKWRDTDLNIGMYLSPEGKESVEMVGESLLRIANSARSLKRGDVGGFMRNLHHMPRSSRRAVTRKFEQGDLSGSFLAAHLGWEPLIKDIYNLSDNVKPIDRYSGNTIKARKPYRPAQFVEQNPSLTKKVDSFAEGQITLKGDLARDPTWEERFGLYNPFLIAWELVPLSFVADYFLPIGTVIDALGVAARIRFKKLTYKDYYTERHNVDAPVGRFENGSVAPGCWGLYAYSIGSPITNPVPISLFQRFTRYERKPYTLSIADAIKDLHVTVPESMMKLSTLASLTHQRILSLGTKKR